MIAATLGAADGVVLIDESGVVKQGHDSVGVAPQYCGAVGKVANCQVGVYLLASDFPLRAVLDRVVFRGVAIPFYR